MRTPASSSWNTRRKRLQEAIERALQAFAQRESWVARMRRGMAKDFSWDTSAAAYQRLYRSL